MGALLTEGLHVKEVLHENRTGVRKECSTTGLFLVDLLDGNFASVRTEMIRSGCKWQNVDDNQEHWSIL